MDKKSLKTARIFFYVRLHETHLSVPVLRLPATSKVESFLGFLNCQVYRASLEAATIWVFVIVRYTGSISVNKEINLALLHLVYTEFFLVWLCRKLTDTLSNSVLESTSSEQWVRSLLLKETMAFSWQALNPHK
jgi:hypothetical protein